MFLLDILYQEQKQTTNHMKSKLHYQVSFNKLYFIALNEVLHDSYLDTKQTIDFDSILAQKLKNLKPSLSRELKKDFQYLEQNGKLPVVQLYHQFCEVLIKIKEVADLGEPKKMEEMIMVLDAFLKDDLKIIDEKDLK
jgi:hypothetical protein